jgi:peptidoglycan/xylan/chitin deacetylase (PgdA/CDA1 family)
VTASAARLPAAVALGALALAAGVAAPGSASAAAWVNPRRHPVTVAVDLPGPATVSLEVERRGAIVHRGRPARAGPGRAVLRWAGEGASADGRYAVRVRDAASGSPLGEPVQVLADLRPPAVRLLVPAPAIPRRAPAVVVRAADVERAGVRVRWRLAGTVGPPRPVGRWMPWSGPADTARLLPALRALRAVGPVRVALEARDGAGNAATSSPAWVDPSSGPTPPLVIVRRVVTSRRWVALTFDDGYSSPSISSILGTLERLHARATFCFNAVYVSRWPSALRARIARAAESGLLGVCNHGYSHRAGRSTSEAFDRADLAANVAWDRVAGVSSLPVYRPPGGDYGPALEAAAHALGYRYLLLWSVDTRDWSGPSADHIRAQVLAETGPGSIVLQHALPVSAAALPGIIAGLRARRLEPVRIDELLAAGRPSL